jgi:hypothetical protein
MQAAHGRTGRHALEHLRPLHQLLQLELTLTGDGDYSLVEPELAVLQAPNPLLQIGT